MNSSPFRDVRWLPCRNDSVEIVPAYACVRVTSVSTIDGQIIYTIVKPTNDAAHRAYGLNSALPVAVGGYGLITMDSPSIAKVQSGDAPVNSQRWGPTANEWHLSLAARLYSMVHVHGQLAEQGATVVVGRDYLSPRPVAKFLLAGESWHITDAMNIFGNPDVYNGTKSFVRRLIEVAAPRAAGSSPRGSRVLIWMRDTSPAVAFTYGDFPEDHTMSNLTTYLTNAGYVWNDETNWTGTIDDYGTIFWLRPIAAAPWLTEVLADTWSGRLYVIGDGSANYIPAITYIATLALGMTQGPPTAIGLAFAIPSNHSLSSGINTMSYVYASAVTGGASVFRIGFFGQDDFVQAST